MPNTICTLSGTLKDSGNTVLSGKMIVTLDINIEDQSTNPDSLLLVQPKEYIITNGTVSIPLVETETKQATYYFQFYRLISVGVYDTKTLFDFHAIIPDVASVEIASLSKETGITTTNLSTGALKVANEILTNPTLANLIYASSQQFKGDTQPINSIVTAGAIWAQPIRGIFWRWDAIRSKWKSNVRELQIGIRNISASQLITKQVPVIEIPNILLERVDLRWYVNTPNDSSNRWGIQLGNQLFNSDTLVNIGTAFSTSSLSTDAIVNQSLSPNSAFLNNNIDTFGMQVTKTGSPGNISVSATFSYSYLQ
jgi:hypothetical protein